MYQPRRVVITGGSSGLGLGFAKALAARGARLVLLARGEAGLASAQTEVEAAVPGARVRTLAVDVSDPDALRAAAARLEADGEGDVDLLVCSAGILRQGYVEAHSDDDYRDTIAINYLGTVHAVRALLPALARSRGRVVNISSMSGLTGVFGYSAYSASKFAVQGFSEALRVELRPQGIAVHVVSPAEFHSPMLASVEHVRTPEGRAHATSVPAVTVDVVVRDTLRGIERGEFAIVPGRLARLASVGLRHFPRISRAVSDRRVARVYVGPRR